VVTNLEELLEDKHAKKEELPKIESIQEIIGVLELRMVLNRNRSSFEKLITRLSCVVI